MDKVRRVIEIASQLGSIQEFCEFVGTIHTVAKCTDSHCPVEIFNRKLKKKQCLMKMLATTTVEFFFF